MFLEKMYYLLTFIDHKVVDEACGETDLMPHVGSEYRQNMALDILIWLLAVMMNDVDHK